MAEVLSVLGVLANVAAVAAAGIRLSQSLYEISKRLINAPKEIAEVAGEMAHLSDMVEILGDVLKSAEKFLKPELLQNAQEILTRFDKMQQDIKDIVRRGAHGFQRLRHAFGWTTLSQLLGKLDALKSSLNLVINMLHLGIVVKRVKNPRNKKSAKLEKPAQSRFRNLAETYVEANRETIRNLRSQAVNEQDYKRSSSKSKNHRETIAFVHWSESPDEVAAWLYFMIFDPNHETVQPKHRKRKKGYAKTVKSQNSNAAASDSEEPEPSSSLKEHIESDPIQYPKTLTDDQERELYASMNSRQTVNSLLGVWTNLSEQQIYEPTGAAQLRESKDWRETIESVILNCLHEDQKEGESWHRKDELPVSGRRVVSATPPPPAPTPQMDERGRWQMILTDTPDNGDTADPNKRTDATGKDRMSGPALSSAGVEATEVPVIRVHNETFEKGKARAESQAAKAYEQSLAEKGTTHQSLSPERRASLRAAKVYQEIFQKCGDSQTVKKQKIPSVGEKGRPKFPSSETDNRTVYTVSSATAGSSTNTAVAGGSTDEQNDRSLGRNTSTDNEKIGGDEGIGRTNIGIYEKHANLRKRHPLETVLPEDDAEDKSDDSDMETIDLFDELEPEGPVSRNNTSQSRITGSQKVPNKPPGRRSPPTAPVQSMTNGTPATGSRESARHPRSARFVDPSHPHSTSYPGDLSESYETNQFSPRRRRDRLGTSSTPQSANGYYGTRSTASTPATFPLSEPSFIGSDNPFAELSSLFPPSYQRGYLPPPPRNPEVLRLEQRVVEAEAARLRAESHAQQKSEEADKALRKAETEQQRRIAELDAARTRFEEEQARDRMSHKLVELENLIRRQEEERVIRERAFEAGKRNLAEEAAERQNIALLNAKRDAEQRAENERKELSEQYEKRLSAAREEAKEIKRQAEEARQKLNAAQEELKRRDKEANEQETEVNPFKYFCGIGRPPSMESEDTGDVDDDDEEDDDDDDDEDDDRSTVKNGDHAQSTHHQEQQTIIKFLARPGWGDAEKADLYASLKHFDILPMFEDRPMFSISQREYYQVPGSGGCEMRGTMFWHPSLSPTESDLYMSLKASGFRPVYMRTTEFGQTWYFGCQPVHVYFFKPCYGPQIPPRYSRRAQGLSQDERLIISKDYVDADALKLSGFQHQILPSGEVLLDPSMDAQDIDNVVRTSFFMKEAKLRNQFSPLRTIRGLNFGHGDVVDISGSETDSLRSANGKSSRKSTRLSRWLSGSARSSSQCS